MRQFIKFCLFLFVGLGSCSSWASLEKHDDRGRLERTNNGIYVAEGNPGTNRYINLIIGLQKEDQDSLPSILRGKGLPFFFTVPQDRFLSSTKSAPHDIIFDLVYDDDPKNPNRDETAPATGIGLRLMLLNDGLSRRDNAEKLTPYLKSGDFILTYRANWGHTGPYPHMQLGISHVGMVFKEKSEDGILRVRNLDMPFNEEMLKGLGVPGDIKSYLNSEHYEQTQLLHILRPRISDQERANLNAWAIKIYNKGRGVGTSDNIYAGLNSNGSRTQIFFNRNYLQPNSLFNQEMARRQGNSHFLLADSFDLWRLAQDKTILYSNQNVYVNGSVGLGFFCSGAAKSILDLRRCNPSDRRDHNIDTLTCLDSLFEPGYPSGSFIDIGGPSSTAGLVDGPLILLKEYIKNKSFSPEQVVGLVNSVFEKGNMAGMSIGHKETAEAIPDALFELVKIRYLVALGYAPLLATDQPLPFELSELLRSLYPEARSAGVVADGPSPRTFAEFVTVLDQKFFNFIAMKNNFFPNYSPTYFMVNALLPNENQNKALDYVMTLAFVAGDDYQALAQTLTTGQPPRNFHSKVLDAIEEFEQSQEQRQQSSRANSSDETVGHVRNARLVWRELRELERPMRNPEVVDKMNQVATNLGEEYHFTRDNLDEFHRPGGYCDRENNMIESKYCQIYEKAVRLCAASGECNIR